MNASSLSIEEAASLIGVDLDRVRADVAAGLPVVDGPAGGPPRIHLIEYVAWMCLRLAELTKEAPRGKGRPSSRP